MIGRRRQKPGRALRAGDAELKRRLIQVAIGLVCACGFLVMALYRVPLDAVAAVLAGTSTGWLGAAVCAYAVNLALRSWRWRMILRQTAVVAYPTVARVLVVGYGLNTIMPLRLGELFRAEFLKETCGVPRLQGLTSIVIERMLDGLTVVACLGAGLILAARTRTPEPLLIDALAAGGALLAAALLAAVCLGGRRIIRLAAAFPRLSVPLGAVGKVFAVLRTWQMVPIVLATLTLYVPEAFAIWCVVKAVGLALGLSDAMVLVGAASLSTLLPSGPGFVGTLQFAYVLAIGFAGGGAATGTAAAVLVQCCLLLPAALVGVALLVYGSGGILRDVWTGVLGARAPAGYEPIRDDPAVIGPTA